MSADRIKVEQMLRYLMEEASRALHRRLLVVSGNSSEEMLAYIIWRHYTLSGGHNRVLYVGYEDSQDAYKSLLDRLKEVYPVDSIKWYSYEDTHKIMGTTNDFLILDMRSGARPNDIGRLVETVRGGGLIVLYNLSLEVDKPWSTSLHRKLVVPPYSEKDLKARFEKRFIRKLLGDPAVWVIKDWDIVKGELLNPPETIREKPIPPKGGKIPAKILGLAITSEQMDMLRRMDVLVDKSKSIVVITSNRGRGKSALLGLTAASLIFLGAKRIIITAPACEEVQTLMRMADKALSVIGEKVRRDYLGDLILKLSCKRGSIEFIPPYRTLSESADAILVDEAGGIPVPLLFRIAEKFQKAVFVSTVHGYEGAGRGFTLRFLKAIEMLENVKIYKFELKEPIRYAPDDPVERWLYDALLLNAEPAELKNEQITVEECTYSKPDLDLWFEKDEEHLRQFIGIYVLAHYRNRPDDLLILGDAPHHSARALLSKSGKVLVAMQVDEEGEMSDDLINEVLTGIPPSGNLIPSCIVKYYPHEVSFSKLKGLRVVRIATHPDLIGKGFGSFMLKKLCEEAASMGFDWVGASFGADEKLLSFWIKNGFIPTHISPMRNIVSGEFSVIVIKPITSEAQSFIREIHEEFKTRLIEALPDTYFNLDPIVAAQLLRKQSWDYVSQLTMTSSQKGRLMQYVKGTLAYEGVCDAIKQLLKHHFLNSGNYRIDLDITVEAKLIARCLQSRSWSHVTQTFKGQSQGLKSELRSYIAKIVEHYGILK